MDQGAIAGNNNFHMDVIREGEATRVKPAEETEKGLYFLSNLDQKPTMMKTVYLYKPSPAKGDVEEAVEVVRESLAKVLIPYHPMAGRLAVGQDGKLFVELTGEGVAFVVAHANFELEELLATAPHPPETLIKLVYDVEGANIFDIPLMTVQVTKFKCGGFGVGTCMNHCLCDGISAVEFLSSWGHVARYGLPLPTPPVLDRSNYLKARDPPRIEFPHTESLEIDEVSGCKALYEAEPIKYRAFVFDGEKIGRLKGKAMDEGGVIKCSTFEVLSAFVWRAWNKALRMSPHQRTKLVFAVDGRMRFNPPLPKGFFGNGIFLPSAICTSEELLEEPLSGGVKRVQETLGMVTDEYMRSGIDYFEKTRATPKLTAATLGITTWFRLSLHSMDFGWGEAVYAGPVGLPMKEVVLFLPHGQDRKDISVYVGLPRSAFHIFEQLVMEI